jgi:hypothetical protein
MSPGGRPGARFVPGLWLMLPGGRPGSFRPWFVLDALQVCPWLARSWLMADVSRCAPGARSSLAYG